MTSHSFSCMRQLWEMLLPCFWDAGSFQSFSLLLPSHPSPTLSHPSPTLSHPYPPFCVLNCFVAQINECWSLKWKENNLSPLASLSLASSLLCIQNYQLHWLILKLKQLCFEHTWTKATVTTMIMAWEITKVWCISNKKNIQIIHLMLEHMISVDNKIN